MEEQDYLRAFYEEHCDEDARLRSRHGMVEYLTTMRYIERYLKQGDKVLEIGAGTGRYSHALAQEGCAVDAVELLEHNIAVFQQSTIPGEPVTIRQGNALDLGEFGDDRYDIVLLLGPMYHLFTVEDQRQALTEAIRVARPGGVVFAAYCGSDATAIQYCFVRGMFKEPQHRALADPVTFKLGSDPAHIFALHRKEEIDALMDGLSVKRLHFVGTDMATGYMRDTIDQMDDELYELYLKYHSPPVSGLTWWARLTTTWIFSKNDDGPCTANASERSAMRGGPTARTERKDRPPGSAGGRSFLVQNETLEEKTH